MDEIISGRLWIGDLPSALNVENLKAHGVQSVLSAMRGAVNVHQTFIRRQIDLDDMEDADLLMHLGPSLKFIGNEIQKGRGVLVHCQAGISRSSSIVAAYLMQSKNLTAQEAIDLIRLARPFVNPNPGFVHQLEVFHAAGYVSTPEVTVIRRFYLNRTAVQFQGVLEGRRAGSVWDARDTMIAGLPVGAGASGAASVVMTTTTAAPTGASAAVRERRRVIRCKMCRQELATREFMLDHGQVVGGGGAAEVPSAPTGDVQPTLSSPSPPQVPPPAPILNDPGCSGYFLEPLKWMEPFLKRAEVAGKITCPNKRCGAKLGNYNWAGARCGCGEWVTPEFCVGRSRVDEVVV